jgi:molecular chaperone HscB
MTYFELFEIPFSLKVNTQELSKKYFELSRKYHPDFFTQSDSASQEEALEMTSMLNKAWKTFKDPNATLRYALTLKGLLDSEEKHQLSPDFLMEMMDINEQLSEGDPATFPAITEELKKMEEAIYVPVKAIIEQYQDAHTSEEQLMQVKEYYFRKKYLDRIRQRLAN